MTETAALSVGLEGDERDDHENDAGRGHGRDGRRHALAAAALTDVTTTAIRKVHLRNRRWAASGRYEYNPHVPPTALAQRGDWPQRTAGRSLRRRP